jgi:hypothetical protein
MSSGQSVILNVADSNGSVVSDTTTKSYSTNGAKKQLIFGPTPASSSVNNIEDLYIQITAVAGVAIERIAVYGTPSDEHLEK